MAYEYIDSAERDGEYKAEDPKNAYGYPRGLVIDRRSIMAVSSVDVSAKIFGVPVRNYGRPARAMGAHEEREYLSREKILDMDATIEYQYT